MAELAAASGRSDVVDQVAQTDNHVCLATDPAPAALVAWLDDTPLTCEEAAFIQPTYGQRVCADWPLSCEQIRLLLGSIGLIGFLWAQWGLLRAAERFFPERTVLQGGLFVLGSVVLLVGLLVTAFGLIFFHVV